MCAAQPADQAAFSAIPAGMPFAARRAVELGQGIRIGQNGRRAECSEKESDPHEFAS